LYPGGQNVRPAAHTAAGLAEAAQILPLDSTGVIDSVNGKIVFLSIGMSNTQQEFRSFLDILDTLQEKNPYLVAVNGAQGGWEINAILDPSAEFWTNITTSLTSDGLSPLQVQVIWFKEAEFLPAIVAADTGFPGYADELKGKFRTAMNIIRAKYPNARLCYVASRIYGGYDATQGNPEPYAYYTGWAAKRLIDEQINGDPGLAFNGSVPQSPWLSWGPYMWADGANPRSDGLHWVCPDDYQPDGRHPSNPVGRAKVAGLLRDYLLSDETAVSWFLR
jgi:hypothetical protein